MAKVVIHIGTHKTGTTYLQEKLAASRSMLANNGIVYPDYGHSAHHGLIAHWNNLPKGYRVAGDPERVWQELARRYSKSDKTLLLSSEEFSRVAENRPDFQKIIGYLRDFESVRLVCFLRDQVSYLQSIYTEVSKIMSPPPPPAIVAETLVTGRFTGVALDYNDLLDTIGAQVSPEILEFHSYDDACRAEGGILGYFLRLMGVSFASAATKDEVRVNESVPPLTVWASNMIAAPRVSTPRLHGLVRKALARRFPDYAKGVVFNPDEIARLIERFEPENERFFGRVSQNNPHLRMPRQNRFLGQLCRRDVDVIAWNEIARELYEQLNPTTQS